MMAAMVCGVESRRNGCVPVAISYSIKPNENWSERKSTSPPRACSGLMYCGVPATVPGSVTVIASWPVRTGRRAGERLRQAEVHDLHAAVARDHHVGGLEVAVGDAGVVRGPEPGRHLHRQVEQPLGRHRASLDLVTELLAFDQLGDDVADFVVDADVVDREDVGMIESAGGPGLFEQSLAAGGIVGDLVAQDLERDFPSQARIPCAVDLAHAAGVERPDDLVTSYPLTGLVRH